MDKLCTIDMVHKSHLGCGITFFKRFIYLFIFRQREKEEEGEKHQCVVASHVPPIGDLAHNPGMCPDWESNLATHWFAGQHSIH